MSTAPAPIASVSSAREPAGLVAVERGDRVERAAERAEALVEEVNERVAGRRQARSGDHQAVSAGAPQLLDGALFEACDAGRHGRFLGGGGQVAVEPRRDAGEHRLDRRRWQGQPLLRARAEEAGRRLDRHRPGGRGAARGRTLRGPVARRAHAAGAVAERIGVEGQHEARTAEVPQRLHRPAEGEAGALAFGARVERIVAMPVHGGKALTQPLELRVQARRRDGAHQHAQPCAVVADQVTFALAPRGLERRPRQRRHRWRRAGVEARLDDVPDCLRSVGIPQLQDGGLREHVGRAEARRMQRVAFDLDRPAFARADQHAVRMSAANEGARVVGRHAGRPGLGHVDIRIDALPRRTRAGAAAERERRRHELHRPAAGEAGGPSPPAAIRRRRRRSATGWEWCGWAAWLGLSGGRSSNR